MFTGLIETIGTIREITSQDENKTYLIESDISRKLQIDQSISHNGVCLTVVAVNRENDTHTVTAVHETLSRSNFNQLQVGDIVNIEKSITLTQFLDGHLVQGHVDDMGAIIEKEDCGGSMEFTIQFNQKYAHLIIPKGSITVDGVSLTVVNCGLDIFTVAIIPHTMKNTRFSQYQLYDKVNLEFDVIGKYLNRYFEVLTR